MNVGWLRDVYLNGVAEGYTASPCLDALVTWLRPNGPAKADAACAGAHTATSGHLHCQHQCWGWKRLRCKFLDNMSHSDRMPPRFRSFPTLQSEKEGEADGRSAVDRVGGEPESVLLWGPTRNCPLIRGAPVGEKA